MNIISSNLKFKVGSLECHTSEKCSQLLERNMPFIGALYLVLDADIITGNIRCCLKLLPVDQTPQQQFLTLKVVNSENLMTELITLMNTPALIERVVLLERCQYFNENFLEDAGFYEDVYEPKKYFSLFDTTPAEECLDDSFESVNKMLSESFAEGSWITAFTITPLQIKQYLTRSLA